MSAVAPAPARSARQRELGQNFLIDPNTLDVIERLADVSGDDVVLEVGGGPGVLSVRLAATARFVHVIELDERLRGRLTDALAGSSNVSLVFGDALRVDLGALVPAPERMVANLPYGIAATLLLRTIDELPTLRSWVVMVQKEVGERFAAAPGSAAYGVPSVLAQLSCDVRVLRPVSRTVFRPVPNVDSVLLGLTRRDPILKNERSVSDLVHAAFAHRRKTLSASLALDPRFGPGSRETVRNALASLDLPVDVRAERLSPAEFQALARELGAA